MIIRTELLARRATVQLYRHAPIRTCGQGVDELFVPSV
jgi:hypothetical protein